MATLTRQRLMALRDINEDDLPTAYAFDNTLELVTQAEAALGSIAPPGSSSVDSMGGIRTTWTTPFGEVRLVFPHEKSSRSYIFWEDHLLKKSGILRDVNTGTLERALRSVLIQAGAC